MIDHVDADDLRLEAEDVFFQLLIGLFPQKTVTNPDFVFFFQIPGEGRNNQTGRQRCVGDVVAVVASDFSGMFQKKQFHDFSSLIPYHMKVFLC